MPSPTTLPLPSPQPSPRHRAAARYTMVQSHSATTATMIARCPFRACVSPGTTTTRSASHAPGIPNGSRSPFTTSTLAPLSRARRSSSRLVRCRRARRTQRERQRDHGPGAHHGGGAAGHPRAVAAPALDQRDAGRERPQCGHHLGPGGVLTVRRTGSTSAPDPVRLGDARHQAAQSQPGIAGRQQVGRRGRAARAVGEHEQEPRRLPPPRGFPPRGCRRRVRPPRLRLR